MKLTEENYHQKDTSSINVQRISTYTKHIAYVLPEVFSGWNWAKIHLYFIIKSELI